MPDPFVRIYFDFVDPRSYLASQVAGLEARGDDGATRPAVEWIGFELQPPPRPLTTIDDPIWAERLRRAAREATDLQVRLDPPRLVPWTRKAHELHLLAGARGTQHAVRLGVFEAYFARGRDIGRVDVLVDVALAVGMDRTETKAALDVDRHEADVVAARLEAESLGVRDVPSVSVAGRLLRDFPDLTDLGTLLPDS